MRRATTIDPKVKQARLEANSAALLELDGPMSDLGLFADLSMSWWLNLVEKNGAEMRDNSGMHLSPREIALVSHAFGQLWERILAVDAIVCAPYQGDAQ